MYSQNARADEIHRVVAGFKDVIVHAAGRPWKSEDKVLSVNQRKVYRNLPC